MGQAPNSERVSEKYGISSNGLHGPAPRLRNALEVMSGSVSESIIIGIVLRSIYNLRQIPQIMRPNNTFPEKLLTS